MTNFPCGQCNLKAATKGQLEIHEKGVHYKIKPYGCMLCDFQASYKLVLKKHIKFKHLKLNVWESSSDTSDYKDTKKSDLNNITRNNGKTMEEGSNEGCQLCQFVAGSEDELLEHLMAYHIVS